VPREAAQLDHITPLCEGGTDARANLQGLCACCHALKSADEARKRARLAKRQQGANN
jgi:5-methylcytosine-specific restriction endonuclease McrA